MNRWGEIGRVQEESFHYIVYSHKYTYGQYDAPWFDIWITNKKAKKHNIGSYNLLQNTFNLKTMRALEKIIKTYVDIHKPQFLTIGAHWDKMEKRLELYRRRIETMGYRKIKQMYYDYYDTYENRWHFDSIEYIFERVEE
jgi:hypothetical protein